MHSQCLTGTADSEQGERCASVVPLTANDSQSRGSDQAADTDESIFLYLRIEAVGCVDSAAHSTSFVIFLMFLLLEMNYK